jgi:hypothetical protein
MPHQEPGPWIVREHAGAHSRTHTISTNDHVCLDVWLALETAGNVVRTLLLTPACTLVRAAHALVVRLQQQQWRVNMCRKVPWLMTCQQAARDE